MIDSDSNSDVVSENPIPDKPGKKDNKSKKKKESGEKQGTRKRCPKGLKKNKDGECV